MELILNHIAYVTCSLIGWRFWFEVSIRFDFQLMVGQSPSGDDISVIVIRHGCIDATFVDKVQFDVELTH